MVLFYPQVSQVIQKSGVAWPCVAWQSPLVMVGQLFVAPPDIASLAPVGFNAKSTFGDDFMTILSSYDHQSSPYYHISIII